MRSDAVHSLLALQFRTIERRFDLRWVTTLIVKSVNGESDRCIRFWILVNLNYWSLIELIAYRLTIIMEFVHGPQTDESIQHIIQTTWFHWPEVTVLDNSDDRRSWNGCIFGRAAGLYMLAKVEPMRSHSRVIRLSRLLTSNDVVCKRCVSGRRCLQTMANALPWDRLLSVASDVISKRLNSCHAHRQS